MEIVEFGPDDREAVRGYVAVTNAVRHADAPWEHDMTEREATGAFRYGWDLEPAVPYLACVDGVAVGTAAYAVSRRDNLHLAWLDVEVHPEHRRRGHGSGLLAALVDRARAEGRTTLGIGWWDTAATSGFARAHGFEEKHVEVGRRQTLAELDWSALDAAHESALPHAAPYELVRQLGRTPEEELEARAVMTAAINDAPTGGLDIEDEVIDAARVRSYETAMEGRGIRTYQVFARHRGTGELAGKTVVGVDAERPHIGEQHDTSVVRAHRGHRLGLLLKLELLRWLREAEPQLATIDTWNAESNRHMIDVNELLGYQVLGRALEYQCTVRPSQ